MRELTIRVQQDGTRGIIIDLAPVTVMENSALGVIVGAQKRLRAHGGWLMVAGASRPVTRLFRAAGLDRYVPMHPTLNDAVNAAQAAAAGVPPASGEADGG